MKTVYNNGFDDMLQRVQEVVMQGKHEAMQTVMSEIEKFKEEIAGRYGQQSKLEKIERYIHLLNQSQTAGREMHKEIDEALKMFRKEAGF